MRTLICDAYVASTEDITVAKPPWFRPRGEVSGRHWPDVSGVPRVRAGRLDALYLPRMAAEPCVDYLMMKASEEHASC